MQWILESIFEQINVSFFFDAVRRFGTGEEWSYFVELFWHHIDNVLTIVYNILFSPSSRSSILCSSLMRCGMKILIISANSSNLHPNRWFCQRYSAHVISNTYTQKKNAIFSLNFNISIAMSERMWIEFHQSDEPAMLIQLENEATANIR